LNFYFLCAIIIVNKTKIKMNFEKIRKLRKNAHYDKLEAPCFVNFLNFLLENRLFIKNQFFNTFI
jgi:hypothetical protein